MVARNPHGTDGFVTGALRLFEAWRRLLGRPFALGDGWFVGTGTALLVSGAVARALLAPDSARAAELLAGGMTVALAFVRLAVMALTLPRGDSGYRRLLWRSWASGLIPFAVAVGPNTSMIAWAVSAGLTVGLLRRGGTPEREARRAVVFAWGAHAAIGAAAWLARSVAVAVLAG